MSAVYEEREVTGKRLNGPERLTAGSYPFYVYDIADPYYSPKIEYRVVESPWVGEDSIVRAEVTLRDSRHWFGDGVDGKSAFKDLVEAMLRRQRSQG